jgi:phenylalanyl-tRNA synthetase beta chain
MRVPLSWLQDYVDIALPINELAHRLTMAGLEVAAVEQVRVPQDRPVWDRETIVVGEVVEVRPHPNADKLTLAVVDHGTGEPEVVVTGAPNIKVGDAGLKAPFARRGARLYDGHQEGWKLAELKPAKIRGVRSQAMICSEKELGLRDSHERVLLLPDDAPVGMPLADYMDIAAFPAEDVVLDLDLTPNLARCFCMIGVAREVAALTGVALRLSSTEMAAEGPPIAGQVEIEIDDPDLCSRYSATLIRDVKIGPSPYWMQRRLSLAGMRPISNIVDITNYVMLEWGQPLHAFDYDALRGREGAPYPPVIIVRRARPGEELLTLDEVNRVLDPEMLLITDPGGSIALAGVMGGYDTEVRENTTNILLEAANFDNINTRRTSQKLKLPSEASLRFDKGIPASLTIPAASRASEFMRQLAGGTIAQGYADTYPVKQETVTVTVTLAEVKRIVGVEIGLAEILRILESLEFRCQVTGEGPQALVAATAPDHRLDVTVAADLIEEIARVFGYERIPDTLMSDELPPQVRDVAREGEERVRDLLAGCGLQEVITYSLVGGEEFGKLLAAEPDFRSLMAAVPCLLPPGRCVRVANILTPEHEYMRSNLLGSLLETLRDNLRYTERVAIFEVAAVYLPREGEPLPDEPRRLSIAMTGARGERTWTRSPETMDFFDLKGVVDTLLERMGVEGCVFAPLQHPIFQPGRAAELRLDGRSLGVMGEVHPLVREAFDLPQQRVSVAELDLEALLAVTKGWKIMRPISRYPAVFQDLAVVVDEGIPAKQVYEAIVRAGGELLAGAQVFDVYRGEQIPPGKKSLAYALTYQSQDGTLTDEEVARVHGQIVRRLREELGAELRG